MPRELYIYIEEERREIEEKIKKMPRDIYIDRREGIEIERERNVIEI
jgi:hypothetical protein